MKKEGVFLLILIAIAGIVLAYTNIPNPGHGGNRVAVYVGTEKTLQQAINDNNFASYTSSEFTNFALISPGHNSNQILVRGQSGTEKTLQQAIVEGDVWGNPSNTLLTYTQNNAHKAIDISVIDAYGSEKTLQQAINDNTLAKPLPPPGTPKEVRQCAWKFYYKTFSVGGTGSGCPSSNEQETWLTETIPSRLNALGITDYIDSYGEDAPTPEELCSNPGYLVGGSESPNPYSSDPINAPAPDHVISIFSFYDSREGFSCEEGIGEQRTGDTRDNFFSPIKMSGDGCDDDWNNHDSCNTVPNKNSYAVYCCRNITILI